MKFQKLGKSMILAATVSSVLSLAGTQAYANLVQNPGFESGDFTGWTIGSPASFNYGSSVLSTDPHSGTHSAFLEAAPGTATLSQAIPVTAGDVYDVSFWLATVSGDGSSFGAYFGGVLLLSGAGSGAGYNEYNYTGLAAGTGVISFSFARDDAFELDDISVTDITQTGVPDAASTAGLLWIGLAGLAGFNLSFRRARRSLLVNPTNSPSCPGVSVSRA
jgi:hypothetical protein